MSFFRRIFVLRDLAAECLTSPTPERCEQRAEELKMSNHFICSMMWLLLLSGLTCVISFPFAAKSVAIAPAALSAARSKSIPFALQPVKLDGRLAGDEGFDPLGLSNLDESLGLDLYWMREAELKHCRIAMLATVGLIGQESGIVFPGMPMASNQIDAFWKLFNNNPGPVFASVVFIGILEIISGIATTEGRKSGQRAPGDFSFNPLNMGKSPESARDLALKEVRNGRLAMIAAAGMLLQACTTTEGALGNLF